MGMCGLMGICGYIWMYDGMCDGYMGVCVDV